MKFRPLHDRVLIKALEGEEKTKGGIIIPDTAKEKPSQGKVLAVGAGARDEAGKLVPLGVKVGDKILYGKHYTGVIRSTFLIGADGKVLKIWRKVSITSHADAVMEAAKAAKLV